MYFAMKCLGNENEEKIININSEPDRWKFIYDIAKAYGFEGIHIGSNVGDDMYVEEYKLDLNNIPDYFTDLKFTLHLGGHDRFICEKDCKTFDEKLENAFKVAVKHKIYDISLHPLDISGFTATEKSLSLEFFHKTISKWVKVTLQNNVSLSL